MTSDHPIKRRKKLIEVAIPLEAINAASAREKSIRHGHPSTLHLWWARRPLAAARAVIFCQMVDDPSAVPEEFTTEEEQENERLRLFALISELVLWESTTNEQVLNRAREEIRRSWRRACVDNSEHPDAAELFNPEKLPGFHDPFAGGGALPLEAQRLGLESYASDLNPVAVLINKAMVEIPPKFAGMSPVNPEARNKKQLITREWQGAEGLAEDVRYYGAILREKANKTAGCLYPKILVTEKMASANETLAPYLNQHLTPIAYIWARTVPSPSPAHSHIHVPLASTFHLSRMKGKEAYINIVLNENGYEPVVCFGASEEFHAAKSGTKQARGANFRCVMSGDVITPKYIKDQGINGRMGQRLLAVVAEGARTRLYLGPDTASEEKSSSAFPGWAPSVDLPEDTRSFWIIRYGLTKFADLFTKRQLVSLGAFADCFEDLANAIANDAGSLHENRQFTSIGEKGTAASDYAAAVCTYLAFAFSGMLDRMSSLCVWDPGGASWGTKLNHVFGRQCLPMTWDFAEANPFSSQTGSFGNSLDYTSKGIAVGGPVAGHSFQADAARASGCTGKVVSTDPPYYDNIPYADLSDFFYVWLRRSIRCFYQDLFPTVAVPKAEELVAAPYRHGGKDNAESFFLDGMTLAMGRIADQSNQLFPITIYYAFKQAETKGVSGTASTGWETFLAAVMEAGLSITGTWPMRTELANRMIGAGTNALASSVVLVCQRRESNAVTLSRNEFRRLLRQRLPSAIKELESANIAPVDVAQAAIGPGMAIFSQAKAVLNPDDSPMSVREALIEINAALDEHLSKDEGSFDADSRFALTFFESYGYSERPYGDAEGLAVARNISVDGVARAGILSAIAGKVQLLRRDQLDDDWDPSRDERLCVWEATQHLIKRLDAGGEPAGAALLAQLKDLSGHGDLAANCRALAYRLYNHCEKTKQAEEARAYNGLVIAWPELEKLAAAASNPVQQSLL